MHPRDIKEFRQLAEQLTDYVDTLEEENAVQGNTIAFLQERVSELEERLEEAENRLQEIDEAGL